MAEILFLGLGYTARPLAERLAADGHRVTGTTRSRAKAMQLAGAGLSPLVWDGPGPMPGETVETADVVIVSTAPDEKHCPALEGLKAIGRRPFTLPPQILYLSSSGVYGDHDGAWVDEDTSCRPGTDRGRFRLKAEQDWQAFAEDSQAKLSILRLAGIYGPGRSAVDSLSGDTPGARAGLTRRIDKPGHVFNRIHRDDIVRGLYELVGMESPPAILNFADDEPSPPADPITFAAGLLGIDPPPIQAFEDIEADLSPMARSFYAESKRLSNARLKGLVGELLYPSYREGLEAIARLRAR
jgi:nucleoside-diphosphate-sugar epimerase